MIFEDIYLNNQNNIKIKKMIPQPNLNSISQNEMIKNWIYSWDSEEYNNLFMINNQYYINILLKMLQIHIKYNKSYFCIKNNLNFNNWNNDNIKYLEPDKLFNSVQSINFENIKSNLNKNSEKLLFKHIKICSINQTYDYFTIDNSITKNRELFLNHLDNITENELFRSNIKTFKKNEKFINWIPLWFEINNYNSIARWFTCLIEINILFYFLNKSLLSSRLILNKKNILNNFKNFDKEKINNIIDKEIEKINKYINNSKLKNENLTNKEEILQILFLMSDNKINIDTIKPNCYKLVKNVNLDKIYNSIIYHNFDKSIFNFETYILSTIGIIISKDIFFNDLNSKKHKEIKIKKKNINEKINNENKQKKKNKKKFKYNNRKNDNDLLKKNEQLKEEINKLENKFVEDETVEINDILIEEDKENNYIISNKKNKKPNKKPKNLDNKNKITTNLNKNIVQNPKESNKIKPISIKKAQSPITITKPVNNHSPIYKEKQQTVKPINTTNNIKNTTSEYSRKPNNHKNNSNFNNSSNFTYIKKNSKNLEQEINQEFENFILNLKKFNELNFDSRNLCIIKLNKIIKDFNPNLFFEIFGSFYNNLMTPFSDIDLVLRGVDLVDKNEIIIVLENLSIFFKNFDFIENINSVLTASVPVVKLDINSKTIDSSSILENNIKIDIIIELKNSYSSRITTNFIKESINDNKLFFDVILLLKFIFSYFGLNNPFQGGLNSLGLSIMIIAIFKKFPDKCYNLYSFIFEFLKFYSLIFNINKYKISLNEEKIFVKNEEYNDRLIILDPNSNLNIASSSFNFWIIQNYISLWFKNISISKNNIKSDNNFLLKIFGIYIK